VHDRETDHAGGKHRNGDRGGPSRVLTHQPAHAPEATDHERDRDDPDRLGERDPGGMVRPPGEALTGAVGTRLEEELDDLEQ